MLNQFLYFQLLISSNSWSGAKHFLSSFFFLHQKSHDGKMCFRAFPCTSPTVCQWTNNPAFFSDSLHGRVTVWRGRCSQGLMVQQKGARMKREEEEGIESSQWEVVKENKNKSWRNALSITKKVSRWQDNVNSYTKGKRQNVICKVTSI